MSLDDAESWPSLQNAVLGLAQATETGLLRGLHAIGLARDVDGQAAWPFARRIATETLVIDAGLARQVAWTLACIALMAALSAWRRTAARGASPGSLRSWSGRQRPGPRARWC
jgi:hypothetical protein